MDAAIYAFLVEETACCAEHFGFRGVARSVRAGEWFRADESLGDSERRDWVTVRMLSDLVMALGECQDGDDFVRRAFCWLAECGSPSWVVGLVAEGTQPVRALEIVELTGAPLHASMPWPRSMRELEAAIAESP